MIGLENQIYDDAKSYKTPIASYKLFGLPPDLIQITNKPKN